MCVPVRCENVRVWSILLHKNSSVSSKCLEDIFARCWLPVPDQRYHAVALRGRKSVPCRLAINDSLDNAPVATTLRRTTTVTMHANVHIRSAQATTPSCVVHTVLVAGHAAPKVRVDGAVAACAPNTLLSGPLRRSKQSKTLPIQPNFASSERPRSCTHAGPCSVR